MHNYSMLIHMLVASLTRRWSRVVIVFAAVVIGTAIVSGLASVYYDIGQKMSRELRTFGANLVLTPASPEQQPYISLEDVSRVAAKFDGTQLVGYTPYLYGVARVESHVEPMESHDVVLVGVRFDQIEKVSPYWRIKRGPAAPTPGQSAAIVGDVVARKLGISPGDTLVLTNADGSRTKEALVDGILTTGSDEENQVFTDVAFAADLLDKHEVASVAYFSVVASLQSLESFAADVQAELPDVNASPIKQISRAEGQVLDKIKSLVFLAVSLILLLTFLCVVITMSNIAIERRREIGLRKALGAQDRQILFEFTAEGGILGIVGGLVGWVLGLPFAQAVGQSVFQSSISLRPEMLPLALLLAGGLAALASLLPAKMAAGVQPALTLRGE